MTHPVGRLSLWLLLAAVGLLATPVVAEACSGGWQAQDLESQLMCPTCHVPLEQSDSQAAQDIRNFVTQRCHAGWSEHRTKQSLIDQFGIAILAAPPFHGFDALAWLAPTALLTAGVAIAAGLAWTWSHRRRVPAPAAAKLDPELAARIDADLKRFE